MRAQTGSPLMPRVVSGLLALMWCVAAWQVFLIPESAIQMAVGAREVPAGVVLLLGGIIAVYAAGAWLGRQPDLRGEDGKDPAPGALWRTLWLLGGGAAFMVLVQPLGFVVPAALCGVGVARAFDAPLSWGTGLICLLISAVFWGVFAGVLGVGLGPALPGLG